MTIYATNLSAIQAASRRISGLVHRTPILTCATINELAGRSVFFKCENLQKVGAFKFRGACNAVLKLDDEIARPGVVTHSSGNHAQALALAARLRGIPAHIVMPSNSPKVKRRAVEGYGGRVVMCQPTLAAREAAAAAVLAETGGTLIPPYNHSDVIAGQGTIALEMLEEIPNLDVILAPVGGGGLVSGLCIAAKRINPAVGVIAAEPAGADDAARSKQAGSLVPQTNPQTIADGLRTSLGELTWPIIRDLVDQVITVSEEAIVAAMRLVWERMKIIIEPSSAVPVAAVLSEEFKRLPGAMRVGLVLSGGNVDLDHLPW